MNVITRLLRVPGRRRHAGEAAARLERRLSAEGLLDVAYTTVDSPVGTLLLAATPKGLVRVAYDIEDHDRVLETLSERISPRVLRAPKRLDAAARELDEYFARRRQAFDLPLDLSLSRGFRQLVQRHLPEIGYGQTRTYGQVAALVGNPKAVRAVGTACATNPLPVVVPCHRVLRADGTPGGYVGGPAAKMTLLSLEAAHERSADDRATAERRTRGSSGWTPATGRRSRPSSTPTAARCCRSCSRPGRRSRSAASTTSRAASAAPSTWAGTVSAKASTATSGPRTPSPSSGSSRRCTRGCCRSPATGAPGSAAPPRGRTRSTNGCGMCHDAGQTKPTAILLRYGRGDWNALHRDLYGDLVFPLQVVINLNEPGVDHTGGEFLLMEQRPRAQSRGTATLLPHCHGYLFTTRDRPVRSARGWSAAPVRHGVSVIRSGQRHTLGARLPRRAVSC